MNTSFPSKQTKHEPEGKIYGQYSKEKTNLFNIQVSIINGDYEKNIWASGE
jgi:hypothetical protein